MDKPTLKAMPGCEWVLQGLVWYHVSKGHSLYSAYHLGGACVVDHTGRQGFSPYRKALWVDWSEEHFLLHPQVIDYHIERGFYE